MRRPVLIGLGLVALAILFWAWFVTQFEQVERKVPVAASAARANPYLAAMRFAERIGWKASLEERPTRLRQASVGATLVLPAGRPWLTEKYAADLLHRIARGDHVIAEIEPARRRDALLDALGVGRQRVQSAGGVFEALLPGEDAALTLEWANDTVIDLGRVHAELVIADARGVRLASMRRDAGRITLVAGMQWLDNRHIGNHDHAELLRQLLQLSPGTRELVVMRAPDAPYLWGWLAEHARGVLIAAAVVLAAALWRIWPRFGPVRPAPQPARRELLEHLRAAGRFRWSRGARSELLAAAREQLERHIASAAPRLAHLAPQERYGELSAQLNIDAQAVSRALAATARSPRDLVQIMATLATIHAGLRGVRRHFRPPKKPR